MKKELESRCQVKALQSECRISESLPWEGFAERITGRKDRLLKLLKILGFTGRKGKEIRKRRRRCREGGRRERM